MPLPIAVPRRVAGPTGDAKGLTARKPISERCSRSATDSLSASVIIWCCGDATLAPFLPGRIMKKLFGIIVVLQAFTTMACAAPAVTATPDSNWSGFYAGGNIGGSWGNVTADYSVTLLADPANSQSMSGAIGGVQAGYNWQQGDWILGLITDFQLSSQTSNSLVEIPSIIDPTDDHSLDLPWFGTVRGTVGFTPGAPWLIYATGGFAYGYVEESNAFSGFPVPGSHSFVQSGWTVGGGVQVKLANNWAATFEYLYLDFGTFDDAAGPLTISSHLTDNVVRVGLNYFFH